MTSPRSWVAFALAACALVAAPVAARADDGDGGGRKEMRRTASCTRSGEATLRLRADDEWIRIELEIEHGRHGGKWAVILLHERRIVYRGTVGSATDGTLRVRRRVPNWLGSDTVVARATEASGEACRVAATV